MTALLTIGALLQAVGAVLGAGGSVFAEIFYLRAIQDGRIDEAERAHLRVVAGALRWGMLILLVGSITLVVTDFVYLVPVQPALTHAYWTLMGLAFAIIFFFVGAFAKSGQFFFWLGGRFLRLVVLGAPCLWPITRDHLWAAIALYLVSAFLIAVALWYARMVTNRSIT